MFGWSGGIILMIKEPLYSNIIMSIKIAKRYKHHHNTHSHSSLPSFYQINPSSSQSIPILISREEQQNGQAMTAQNKENWDAGEQQERVKCLGFFDLPTNISEFQEIHKEEIFGEPPSFLDLPSISEQYQAKFHHQRIQKQ